MNLFFFRNVFFIHRNQMGFFRKSATIQCARWAEKTHVFFGNARPKSNARAHLKQRKKHSGLRHVCMRCENNPANGSRDMVVKRNTDGQTW